MGQGRLRELGDEALLDALRALYAPGAPEPDVAELTAALRGRSLAVPVPGGAVEVDLGDWTSLLIVRMGAWEPHLAGVARSLVRPGDVVVDAGAHVGTWSLFLAALAGATGRVVAYEPFPESAARARAALGGRATVIEAALGERAGRARLHAARERGGRFAGPDAMLRSLLRTGDHDDAAAVDVDVTTLDDAGLSRVDFLKIDTEGSELAVLRGARQLLARSPDPRLLVELHAEELAVAGLSAGDVVAELRAGGMAVFDLVIDGAELAARPLAPGGAPSSHHVLARRDPTPFAVPLRPGQR